MDHELPKVLQPEPPLCENLKQKKIKPGVLLFGVTTRVNARVLTCVICIASVCVCACVHAYACGVCVYVLDVCLRAVGSLPPNAAPEPSGAMVEQGRASPLTEAGRRLVTQWAARGGQFLLPLPPPLPFRHLPWIHF